jgi:hypothetical protein
MNPETRPLLNTIVNNVSSVDYGSNNQSTNGTAVKAPRIVNTNGNNNNNNNDIRDGNSMISNDSSGSSSPGKSNNIFSRHNLMLLIYLITSVAVAAANSITWKRTLNKFRAVDGSDHNLEFFVNQFTVFLYVVLAACILGYRWIFTDYITKSQKQYPKRKFALMGFMDACAGVAGY